MKNIMFNKSIKKITAISILIFGFLNADDIEGRWHIVGLKDNTMYQFEDGYRYTIYSTDGTFGGITEALPNPNPYTVDEDIITIDLFFGNLVNYQMNFIYERQVVTKLKFDIYY